MTSDSLSIIMSTVKSNTNPFMSGSTLWSLAEEDCDMEEAEATRKCEESHEHTSHVMMHTSEWLQVYLRLKPCNNVKSNCEVKSDRCLILADTATAGHGHRTQQNMSKMYRFSRVFGPDSCQKHIFENVVKDNLKRLTDNHNFTLLTYGASGSGKTYTLMGTVESPGLVPQALDYVFKVVDAAQQPLCKPSDGGAEKLGDAEQEYELQFVKSLRQVSVAHQDKYRRMSAQLNNDFTQSTFDLSNRTRYYIWVSFVEIYNEAIYDLLTQSDRSKASSKLRIREDKKGNAYVQGATQVFVRSGAEAYDVMVAGKHNLQVAATGVHAHSSRSHCIFTITMLTDTGNGVRTSYVRLCDLAGCERAQKTRNTGARMQESRAINSSLHVLERCLQMLRKKQRQKDDSTMVPYRESKLTRLLGASLSGAKGEAVSMVVTLNPTPQCFQENKHVLQLAAVARDIEVNHTIIAESTMPLEFGTTDTTIDCSAEVMKLRADNERLQFEVIQGQTRIRELLASMEEKQQEMATMPEIVGEAKDMTEMLLNQVAELTRRNLILEDNITEGKLARARLEEELQHLRACIEERDEKSEHSENNDEIVEVTNSEEDNEDEASCNESLEPTFTKEDINRSRLQRKSILSSHNCTPNDTKLDAFDDNDSVQEKNSARATYFVKDSKLFQEKSDIRESVTNEIKTTSDADKPKDNLRHEKGNASKEEANETLNNSRKTKKQSKKTCPSYKILRSRRKSQKKNSGDDENVKSVTSSRRTLFAEVREETSGDGAAASRVRAAPIPPPARAPITPPARARIPPPARARAPRRKL